MDIPGPNEYTEWETIHEHLNFIFISLLIAISECILYVDVANHSCLQLTFEKKSIRLTGAGWL